MFCASWPPKNRGSGPERWPPLGGHCLQTTCPPGEKLFPDKNARTVWRVYADMRFYRPRLMALFTVLLASGVPGTAQKEIPRQRGSNPSSASRPRAGVISMPPDRAADSYSIYSMLMPGRTLASLPSAQGAPWAIAAVTVGEAERNPQIPPQGQLKPPADNVKGFGEAVGDYEANRYTRVRLERSAFHLDHAFELVSPDTAKTAGYPGVTYFSEVYFDSKHRAALVFMYEWCANLCAAGTWVYLEKHGGQWERRSGVVVPGT